MPRRPSPPPPKAADWPPEKTLSALKKQLTALDSLRGRRYDEAENEEETWSNLTHNVLTHGFGENSNNVKQYYHARSAGEHYIGGMGPDLLQSNFAKRVEAYKTVLDSSIAELELEMEGTLELPEGVALAKADSRYVFLIHGHDDGAKETVARLLGKLHLDPIILHEQPNKGRTVIEKFEAHSDVGFAVALLTPDDVGGSKDSPDKLNPRARQNVILELGYFIGKLSRARVCALHVEGVELPSDIHGVIYVPFDAAGAWRWKLAAEIRAAGIDVDMNRI